MLEKVKGIAKRAGEETLRIYNNGFEKELKKDGSEITKADKKSEEIIEKGLAQFDYLILSEEKKEDLSRLKEERVWIVDPLDGTSDFVAKTGDFSVMIALIEGKTPVLSVIYNPASNEFYYARKGKGSFYKKENKKEKLSVSETEKLSKSRIVTSRFHLSSFEKNLSKKYTKDSFERGGAGIKISLIAKGEAEIYLNPSGKTGQWDTAAGQLILEEAGGIVTNLKGEELRYNRKERKNKNGVLAANNKKIHESVLEKFKNF